MRAAARSVLISGVLTLGLAVDQLPAQGPSLRARAAPLELALPSDPAPVVVMPLPPFPRAEPASLRVVSVAIPDAIVAVGGSFYLAERGSWSVLGPRAGILERGDSIPLAYTLAVPALAVAGENQAALVRFVTSGDARAFDVPLMVDVIGRIALTVESERGVLGGRAGERVRTSVRVHNSGNVPASVSLRFTGPSGWVSQGASGREVEVARGSYRDVPVEIRIPHDVGYGDFSIGVAANVSGSRAGTATLGVRVARPSFGAGSGTATSVADLSVGAVQDHTGALTRAFTAHVQTDIPGDIHASGRFSDSEIATGALSASSLGRLGFSNRVQQLRLSTRTWEANFGNVGGRSPGMSGYGLFGDGATAILETDDWRGHGLAIAPVGRGDGGGRYLLAGASRRIGTMWAGLEVGDLSDGLLGGRYSRTVTADVVAPTPLVDARVQVGRRETSFGTGLAWLMDLSRRTDDWSAGLSLGRSPGGGAAFARTEREFSAEGSAQVSPRVSLGAALWSNADGAAAGRPFRSSGWNSHSGIRIDDRTNVNLELRHNRWSSDNALGDISNENTQLGGTVSSMLGRWQLRAGARGGEVVRSSEIAGIGLTRISAPQVSLHGGAMLILQVATLSLDATREVAGAGVGLPSSQTGITLRADRVPVWRDRIYGYAEYSRFTLGASGAALNSQIAGVEIRLPGEFSLTLDGSRNTLLRSAMSDNAPWVLAMRLRRSLGFAGWHSGGASGSVFVDRNANGRRDRGEDGLAGVLVDGGVETAMTDRNGRYRMSTTPGTARVDPRSLPLGFLVSPTSEDGGVHLAVVPIAPVEVRVTVENPDRIPLDGRSLTRIVVSLVDGRGRLWTNAVDSAGVARFDALPVGTYRVEADASAHTEPLAPTNGVVTVRVEGGGPPQRVTIILAPRRIRVEPVPTPRRIQLDGARGPIGLP